MTPENGRLVQVMGVVNVTEGAFSDGGRYSAQDADSLSHPGADHAEEGAYYVWTPAQVAAVLGEAGLTEDDEGAAAPFVEFFRNVVVNRGEAPMVPGEVIAMTMPTVPQG